MPTQKTILYAYSAGSYDGGLVESIFNPHSITIVRSDSSQKVLDMVSQSKFDLILTDVLLAPGYGAHDERLMEIFRGFKSKQAYGEIALYFIRRVREQVLNSQTPIVIATTVDENNSGILPDAKRRALEAGANIYVNLFIREDGYNLLERVLLKELGLEERLALH